MERRARGREGAALILNSVRGLYEACPRRAQKKILRTNSYELHAASRGRLAYWLGQLVRTSLSFALLERFPRINYYWASKSIAPSRTYSSQHLYGDLDHFRSSGRSGTLSIQPSLSSFPMRYRAILQAYCALQSLHVQGSSPSQNKCPHSHGYKLTQRLQVLALLLRVIDGHSHCSEVWTRPRKAKIQTNPNIPRLYRTSF